MGISRKQLHVPVLPLHVPEGPFLGGRHPDGLRGLSRGRGQAREVEPSEAARAREAVLGRPLRPAPSSEPWGGFWSRVDLFAWGRGLRVLGGRPAPRAQPKASRARWQEPAQAPAQPRDQPEALQPQEPRGAPHSQPFMLLQKISFQYRGTRRKKHWCRAYLPRCHPRR